MCICGVGAHLPYSPTPVLFKFKLFARLWLPRGHRPTAPASSCGSLLAAPRGVGVWSHIQMRQISWEDVYKNLFELAGGGRSRRAGNTRVYVTGTLQHRFSDLAVHQSAPLSPLRDPESNLPPFLLTKVIPSSRVATAPLYTPVLPDLEGRKKNRSHFWSAAVKSSRLGSFQTVSLPSLGASQSPLEAGEVSPPPPPQGWLSVTTPNQQQQPQQRAMAGRREGPLPAKLGVFHGKLVVTQGMAV